MYMFQSDDSNVMQVDNGLAGLLASIGLLVASVAELLVSGYSCLTLTPKLCGCLRNNITDETTSDGHLKTRNMVHQWVIAQNHVPTKNQQPPIYMVQPMPMSMHPMIQVNTRSFLPRPPTTTIACLMLGGGEGGGIGQWHTRLGKFKAKRNSFEQIDARFIVMGM